MDIRIKRAYDSPAQNDGYRILVDRIWPRGVAKKDINIDDWDKELAPSDDLRTWFNHDADKWEEFQTRYKRELDDCSTAVNNLLEHVIDGRVTLVYGAKDENHNNAVVLRDYLREKSD